MKRNDLLTSVLFISIILSALSQNSNAYTSFDINMLYKRMGLSDQTSSVKPDWLITNTSSQSLVIGGAGSIPFASMDFENLPILSPGFIFHPEVISGYTLNPGDTIGWIHFPSSWELPIIPPTYNLTGSTLFEFNGNYIPGTGTGNLTFGIGSAYVDVPITFGVKEYGDPPNLIGVFNETFSSVPEPATFFLLSLGAIALRRKIWH